VQVQEAASAPSLLLILSVNGSQFDLFGHPVQRCDTDARTVPILNSLFAQPTEDKGKPSIVCSRPLHGDARDIEREIKANYQSASTNRFPKYSFDEFRLREHDQVPVRSCHEMVAEVLFLVGKDRLSVLGRQLIAIKDSLLNGHILGAQKLAEAPDSEIERLL
jgi:hypothetical protein